MIIRDEKKGNYTILPNELLLDETISDKARGVLVRVLSRPDNWNLNINHLVKTGKDGHAAIRSAIRELEDAGYLKKDVARHADGRIRTMEYIICESPAKSCGEISAPEQPCMVVDNDNDVAMPDPEPESIVQETQAMVESEPEIQAHADQIMETHHAVETHMQKISKRESAPIINTDIKQILRVTTTTTPEPVICDQAMPMPLPSSCTSNAILNLIPEKHRSPMVVTFVNKAIVDYPEKEVEQAVAYAAENVRGGSMQFRAYLDKTLRNKWAEGYLDTISDQQGMSSWLPPRGRFPNGTVTGCKRMDNNYMVAAQFLTEMGVDLTEMCAEA